MAGKGWRCAVLLEDTHTKSIRCCCWSPGGTHLASASFDGTTSIWAVQQGIWEEVRMLLLLCCSSRIRAMGVALAEWEAANEHPRPRVTSRSDCVALQGRSSASTSACMP